jgi:hypothetical protein
MAWIRQHKSRVHRLISAMLPCLSVAPVQQCSHISAMQQCYHVSALQQCSSAATSRQCSSATTSQQCNSATTSQQCNSAATFQQCNHISASQDIMVQGYKRRWSGGQPSSKPTPVDGSIELLVLQYCPILSCLVLSCISPLGCSQVSLPCLALVRSIIGNMD